MNLVYDSSALISYLENEPGAEDVTAWLANQSNNGFIHAINMCEVFYHVRRKYGEETAIKTCSAISQLNLDIREDLDEELWQEAGRIKADYKRVSLADCFCVALANRVKADIVTSDRHEIRALVNAGVCTARFIR